MSGGKQKGDRKTAVFLRQHFFGGFLPVGKTSLEMRLFSFDLRRQAERDLAGLSIFRILFDQRCLLLSLAKVYL